ncbi:MAG: lytic transglycosylase domain-containing protein [Plesiomonas shigelloides]
MANPFDKFDEPAQQKNKTVESMAANPFDQFDTAPEVAPISGAEAPQQEPQSLLGKAASVIGEAFTGSERMTPEMQQLEPVGNAPELNELNLQAAKMGLAQLFGSDKSQEQILQQMGGVISQDERGNTIVELPSGRYALNKPGLSPQDIASGVAQVAAFAPAAGAGTVGRAALGAAGTEAVTKGLVEAAGGEEVNPIDVAAAGALGGAGKFGEKAIGAAYRMASGKPTGDAAIARQFAEEQGVPLMTSDIAPPQTFVGKSAQSAAEKVPFAGTGAPRAEQQQARVKLVEDFAQRFGAYDPAEVVSSLQRQTSKVKQAAGAARQGVMQQMQGVQVTPSNAIKAIDDEVARLSKSPSGAARETADTATIQKLQAYKADLESDSTFDNLEQLRTNFRTDVKGERMVMPTRSEASINKIYGAMSKDMSEAIDASLPPEQARKWAQQNAIFHSEAEKIKGTRLKNILQKGNVTPEAVNTMLFSNKPSETKALYLSLDQKGRDAMRAGLVGKAMEKSAGSPDRFLNELSKMGGKIGIAFKGGDRHFIEGLQRYLSHTKQASTAGVLTPTGQQMMQVAVPAAVTGDVMTTGGMSTLAALGYGGLARAYESKPMRNAMLKLRALEPGSTDFEQHLAKVQKMLISYAQSQTE